jgi:EAL domain-containing protein (putative c-di-GMP-specific phosphodiesterase class I)
LADAACFVAKDQGRNRAWLHSLEDSVINQSHGEMLQTSNITQALEENRFILYRQLIRPINDANPYSHYELLLRMIDSDGNLVSPNSFIPAAERYGIMMNIDKWVIEHALGLLRDEENFDPNISMWTINLSGQSLTDTGFLKFVLQQFEQSQVNPHKVCFEVTETAAIANWINASRFIDEMKKLGCCFALDDFGSGMSSFSYLKKLNIDYLKIDGSFVRNITHDPQDHAMVKAMHQVGQVMGLRTIAEFVENDDILNALEEIGIDYVQGHGIHEPEPL